MGLNGAHQFGYDKKNDPNNSMNVIKVLFISNFKNPHHFQRNKTQLVDDYTSLPPNWLHKHNVGKGKKLRTYIYEILKRVGHL